MNKITRGDFFVAVLLIFVALMLFADDIRAWHCGTHPVFMGSAITGAQP